MDDERRRLGFAKVSDLWLRGQISRREFIRSAFLAGFGSCIAAGCHRPPRVRQLLTKPYEDSDSPMENPEQRSFLKEMSRRFAGTTLRLVSEATLPSLTIRNFAQRHFAMITGIKLEWELLPLDRLLAKISADTALKTGTHDIFYLDQQWVARFADDLVDTEPLLQQTDLAYPDFHFSDILPELINALATYNGRLVGIPFDILIQIMIYRSDSFRRVGIPLPRTIPDYLKTVRHLNRALSPGMHGTTGMWKAGSLSLYGDYASYLWAHGGSFFRADGTPAVGDDNAIAALEFMTELANFMPSAVTTWDWQDEARSFARGEAAVMFQTGEWFSLFDDPNQSKIDGLAEAAPCPVEIALRPKQECGFSEVPGISRQFGGALCISRYSEHRDAAWVFMQWATSAEVTTRSCLVGASNPIRLSNYQDPRVKKQIANHGVTRHFPVTLDAIRHRMGSDPKSPQFPRLAGDYFAVELGRMTTGLRTPRQTAKSMHEAALGARNS